MSKDDHKPLLRRRELNEALGEGMFIDGKRELRGVSILTFSRSEMNHQSINREKRGCRQSYDSFDFLRV